ncbi:MAG: bifunctional phosphoribosylaminoimidazolecarboxamide formyltransferase/IMP cyclohydrolase [bacterium]
MPKPKRALISVSNKEGVVDFARALSDMGVEIISTGGTARLLAENGICVRSIDSFTGFPEILDGRVKTLHPKVYGGLLAVRDDPKHMRQIEENNLELIDIVAVNLYPFAETISREGVSLEEAIENIDIGGVSLLRAAAKNYRDVIVVADPKMYGGIVEELRAGEVSLETRYALAVEAFSHTAQYDSLISGYLRDLGGAEGFPPILNMSFRKVQDLRYGENPHQGAAFYREISPPTSALVNARQLQGKELSFNNILDLQAAWDVLQDFTEPTVVVIKHNNPCGLASGGDIFDAYTKAWEGDPVSAFGSVIGVNRPVEGRVASEVSRVFVEVILAPKFTEEALKILSEKKNLRLLELPGIGKGEGSSGRALDFKRVSGGLLVQDRDSIREDLTGRWKIVTKRHPSEDETRALNFAWKAVKFVKSNAIVIAGADALYGVGAGQMSRVDAVEIAIKKAGDRSRGAVLASDAFFPFRDSVDAAARAGITAIVQPGGSVRDEDSISACDEYGIAMVFTGIRHFRH